VERYCLLFLICVSVLLGELLYVHTAFCLEGSCLAGCVIILPDQRQVTAIPSASVFVVSNTVPRSNLVNQQTNSAVQGLPSKVGS
jgi:hypothetical protein